MDSYQSLRRTSALSTLHTSYLIPQDPPGPPEESSESILSPYPPTRPSPAVSRIYRPPIYNLSAAMGSLSILDSITENSSELFEETTESIAWLCSLPQTPPVISRPPIYSLSPELLLLINSHLSPIGSAMLSATCQEFLFLHNVQHKHTPWMFIACFASMEHYQLAKRAFEGASSGGKWRVRTLWGCRKENCLFCPIWRKERQSRHVENFLVVRREGERLARTAAAFTLFHRKFLAKDTDNVCQLSDKSRGYMKSIHKPFVDGYIGAFDLLRSQAFSWNDALRAARLPLIRLDNWLGAKLNPVWESHELSEAPARKLLLE